MTRRDVSTRTELPATLPLLVVAYAAVARSWHRTPDCPSEDADAALVPSRANAGHPSEAA